MVQDLKDFLGKVNEDKALRERLGKIIRGSTKENAFDNCNAVAAEMGYTITQEDLQTYADEYQEDLSDEELDKVAGGTDLSLVLIIFSIQTICASVVASLLESDK